MALAAISDIHGNLPALKAVLNDLPPVDRIVCAGDVVGYNPWPKECVQHLQRDDIPTVMGNHDRAVARATGFRFNRLAQAGIRHARETLDGDELTWLRSLPDERTLCEGRIKIVHGHPRDPNKYTYPEEFGPELLGDEDLLLLGHTHVQHAETYETGIVCNPGSVGQPRDGDPRAAYAIIDMDAATVDERRVSYNIDEVVNRIDAVGLPRRLGSRLRNGR